MPSAEPTRAESAANTNGFARGISDSMCLAISAGPMVLSANTSAIEAPSSRL
jgi:hypothetical protein